MEDFPRRVADLLEDIAARVRAMTVDRLGRAVKWASLGCVVGVLVFIAFTFLLVAGFRVLGEAIGVTGAYGAIGGLFVVAGAFLWGNRYPKNKDEE